MSSSINIWCMVIKKYYIIVMFFLLYDIINLGDKIE